MSRISNFFRSEIQGKEGIISIDEKDFINFSSKAKIKTFEQNCKPKEWLNKKTLKVQRLIICIFIPKREIKKFKIEWISNILTIFESIKQPIFGIYINNKQKRIKITLISE
ncbi:MAG: hypothetical protein J1E16_02385 [Muribaculaceae bacterium]|nr:hypothetical protein [Muribaculaceae bacterium]